MDIHPNLIKFNKQIPHFPVHYDKIYKRPIFKNGGHFMGKNMKKVLSYALGIILAMGIGLTYAYAVGANDSNAFVTRTEWQQKMNQLKASLDNISKTINDSNMDFVMNGPRFQTSFIDGFENISNPANTIGRPQLLYPWFEPTLSSVYNLYPRFQNLFITDQWNGTQAIGNIYFPTGNVSAARSYVSARFALKSNEPNIYVIVTIYDGNQDGVYSVMFTYLDISVEGNQARDYSSAKTVEFTLSLDDWWVYPGGTAAPTNYDRTSNGVSTGRLGDTIFYNYMDRTTTTPLSNPGTGYVKRVVTGNNVTFTLEFPAAACTIRHYGGTSSPYSVWNLFPIDMSNRKFGGIGDKLYFSTAAYGNAVGKVYSPQKGCLCLKNYLNGEIPILNE